MSNPTQMHEGADAQAVMASGEAEDIAQIRDLVRRFVSAEMPRGLAAQWDDESRFPRDVFDKLAALGVMGLPVPEAYGGLGRNIVGTMVVIEELSRRSLAVAIPYINAACYAGMNIAEFGTPAQRADLLPRVVAGRMIFAYGLSEPDVGADLAGVRTRAVRSGDTFLVNGSKRFITGASECDLIYTLVRSGPQEARYRNLSLLMIPPGAPGVSIAPIRSMGLKGFSTTDVTFDNVRVPVENVLGGEARIDDAWSMLAGVGLDVEKLEVAAMAVGISQAAFDDAWSYSLERRQFGKPIAEYQSIRHKLADMKTQLHAARLMLYDAAALCDGHLPCATQTSMAKLFATEACKSISLECQTILGAYGYVKGLDAERYVRDALGLPIIGGSSAIQRNNIYKSIARGHS